MVGKSNLSNREEWRKSDWRRDPEGKKNRKRNP